MTPLPIAPGWLVWFVFDDFLNWEAFPTRAEAIAEAHVWERAGLEVGIRDPQGAECPF